MRESEIREKLTEIDDLRERASLAERMHTHWLMHDGELVEVHEVTLRRRWRSPQTTHSEIVLTREERDMLREWLSARALELRARAADLAATLGSTEGQGTDE